MATEAQDTPVTTEAPAIAPKVKEAPKEPPQASKPAQEQGKEPAAKESKKISIRDDEEEIPEDAALIEMSKRQLDSRLNRFSKRQLKDHFGTDDVESIKTRLARAKELEEKEESRRRDQLSKEQKLEEDLRKEKEARIAADRRAEAIHNERVFDREETRVIKIAEKHIDPDYVEAHLAAFAKHLNKTYSKAELEKLGDGAIEEWWKELAEKKPKFARETRTDERPKHKTPITNSPKGERPNGKPESAGAEQKSMAPGKSNSMTSAEARQAAAKEGYRW